MDTTFENKLLEYRNLILTRLSLLIEKPAPASLYDAMRYTLSSPGKLIRPTLLLLSCQTVGGKPEVALDAATAIELIHNFTLVHDDIMDHDELRRGRETVYKKWDENTAILVGDALLVLAYSLLATIETPCTNVLLRKFSQSILEVCEGQALDKEFENCTQVTLEEYFRMIEKKTGQLFALACESGAIIGGGTPEQISNLQQFGFLLGRAFQLQDDVLDILGNEKTIGKDVGSDLQENKKTYLITYASHMGNHHQQEKLSTLIGKKPLNKEKIDAIIDLFSEIGAIKAAQFEIMRCLQKASDMCSSLPSNEAQNHLISMLSKIAARNK